jgi:hypothetical protein
VVVMVAVNAVIVRVVSVGADAPDMMVVADLCGADVTFVADDLFAVFAQLAIHGVVPRERLLDTLDEGIDQQLMIVEIGRLEDFDFRVIGGGFINPVVNAAHQDSGEQKIREYDDPPVT